MFHCISHPARVTGHMTGGAEGPQEVPAARWNLDCQLTGSSSAPHLLWSRYSRFEQTYNSNTELYDFQEYRENSRAQTSSVLQAAQRHCYLPSWRHRCASRYFTSEEWRWRRREASIGVRTRSSVRIRKYGLEEAAAGGAFSRACEKGTENMVNTMVLKS